MQSEHKFQYFSKAMIQYLLLQDKLQEQFQLKTQIEELKQKLYSMHSKHRRTDKEIIKNFKCNNCQRVYASDVALRLHVKLKHSKQNAQKMTIHQSEDYENLSFSLQQQKTKLK